MASTPSTPSTPSQSSILRCSRSSAPSEDTEAEARSGMSSSSRTDVSRTRGASPFDVRAPSSRKATTVGAPSKPSRSSKASMSAFSRVSAPLPSFPVRFEAEQPIVVRRVRRGGAGLRGCCCPSRCASATSKAPQALRSVARSPLLVRAERGAPVGEALSKRHKRPPPLVCHMPLAVFFIIFFLRFFFFVVGSADTPSEPLGLD
mmetsp:Transcript_16905/g.49515  ORF Transcript_16905/g.49515 Transcript_16905/m.49515 type:complete len:204 (-) Transcript_16905:527-1138(-)